VLVSSEKRFIFVHNPKCAGTSFRDKLKAYHDYPHEFWGISYNEYFQRDMDYAHLRLWELASIYPDLLKCFDDYNSLVLVRNPFDKFLSAVTHHFTYYRQDEQFFKQSTNSQIKAVENFIRDDLTMRRIQTDFRYVHFSPQTWFINLGKTRKVRNVLPMRPDGRFSQQGFELLGVQPPTLKVLNTKSTDIEVLLRSNFVFAFVNDFYQQDFKLLNDDRELRPLVELSGRPQFIPKVAVLLSTALPGHGKNRRLPILSKIKAKIKPELGAIRKRIKSGKNFSQKLF